MPLQVSASLARPPSPIALPSDNTRGSDASSASSGVSEIAKKGYHCFTKMLADKVYTKTSETGRYSLPDEMSAQKTFAAKAGKLAAGVGTFMLAITELFARVMLSVPVAFIGALAMLAKEPTILSIAINGVGESGKTAANCFSALFHSEATDTELKALLATHN